MPMMLRSIAAARLSLSSLSSAASRSTLRAQIKTACGRASGDDAADGGISRRADHAAARAHAGIPVAWRAVDPAHLPSARGPGPRTSRLDRIPAGVDAGSNRSRGRCVSPRRSGHYGSSTAAHSTAAAAGPSGRGGEIARKHGNRCMIRSNAHRCSLPECSGRRAARTPRPRPACRRACPAARSAAGSIDVAHRLEVRLDPRVAAHGLRHGQRARERLEARVLRDEALALVRGPHERLEGLGVTARLEGGDALGDLRCELPVDHPQRMAGARVRPQTRGMAASSASPSGERAATSP